MRSDPPASGVFRRLGIPLSVFFAVTAEMAPAGAVRHIAAAFGTDVPTAALGTAIYAAMTAVAAMPLSLALQGASLRKAYMFAGVVFAVANLATASAPDLPTYLIIRGLNGVAHGAFFSLALALAANSTGVRPERGVAEALLGNAFALAVGVPVAEHLSAADWRTPFVITAGGVLISVLCAPQSGGSSRTADLRRTSCGWFSPVLQIGLIFAVALAGHFAFYAFLAPQAWAVGIPAPALLSVYGTTVVLGTALSGRIAGRSRLRRAAMVLAIESVALLAASWWSDALALAIASVLAGLCFGVLPTLVQSEMLHRSGSRQTIASGMAVVAFNCGIAAGAFLGRTAARLSVSAPTLVAAIGTACAAGLFVLKGASTENEPGTEAGLGVES